MARGRGRKGWGREKAVISQQMKEREFKELKALPWASGLKGGEGTVTWRLGGDQFGVVRGSFLGYSKGVSVFPLQSMEPAVEAFQWGE